MFLGMNYAMNEIKFREVVHCLYLNVSCYYWFQASA